MMQSVPYTAFYGESPRVQGPGSKTSTASSGYPYLSVVKGRRTVDRLLGLQVKATVPVVVSMRPVAYSYYQGVSYYSYLVAIPSPWKQDCERTHPAPNLRGCLRK
eukprot:scaffold57147_cov16-Prasinocladus_malaysianus.AAC.1